MEPGNVTYWTTAMTKWELEVYIENTASSPGAEIAQQLSTLDVFPEDPGS